MQKPKDVDEYIANCDLEAQAILNEIRAIIRSTVPQAEEVILYGVPFYRYCGEFVGFAAYKKHVSFGFGTDALQRSGQEILENRGYKLGKGTMQIKLGQEVPAAEIQQILAAKAKMNEAQSAKQ